MQRLVATLALLLVAAAPGMALACATPTRFSLRNETAQPVPAVLVDDDEGPRRQPPSTFNHLPPPGVLAPGEVATITLPSCIGIYVLRAVFADGTQQRLAGIDALSVRRLALRRD